ncbi:MAG TPA: DUF4177 domain-containing protein [Candidatus Acidoferrum sp.]|jgi:hypothetical protein|nr:DUF4177 domain-containing protein [Candidatus Acidoferrum sp.]
MKQCVALVFAASVLLLAGCCTTPRVVKWEYKVAAPPPRQGFGGPGGGSLEEVRENQQAFLNELGKDGWVLVSQNDGRVFFFKRPIK